MPENEDHTEPDWSELGTEYLEDVPTTMQSIPSQRPYLQKIFQKYGSDGVITFEGFEHLLESLGLGNIAIEDHGLREHTAEGLFQDFHKDHEHGSEHQDDRSHVQGDSSTESHRNFRYGVDSSHESHGHNHGSDDEHVDHDHSKHSRDSDRFEIIHNQHNHDNHEDDNTEGQNVSTEHVEDGITDSKKGNVFSENRISSHDQQNDLNQQHRNDSDLDIYSYAHDPDFIDNTGEYSNHSHHSPDSTPINNHHTPVQNLPQNDSHIADSNLQADKDDISDNIDIDSQNERRQHSDNEGTKDGNPIRVEKRSQNVHSQPNQNPVHFKHSPHTNRTVSGSAKNSEVSTTTTQAAEVTKNESNSQSYSGWSNSGSRIITNDRTVFNEDTNDDSATNDDSVNKTENTSRHKDPHSSEKVNSRTVRHISHPQAREVQRHSRRHERVSGFRKMKQKRNRKAKSVGSPNVEEHAKQKRSIKENQVRWIKSKEKVFNC